VMTTDSDTKLDTVQEGASSITWTQSLRRVMSNKNFTVFLLTNWVFASFGVVNRYFNLYLRDIGISYILIGLLLSMLFFISLFAELIGGYLADNFDRRKLAIITIAINSLAFFILACAIDFWSVALGFLTFGLSSVTGKGGSAYIMEQIDKKYGGVAVSLFTLGTVLGLIPLLAFSILLDTGLTFIQVMRTLLLVAGIAYFGCVVVRIFLLDPSPAQKRDNHSGNVLSDFLSETKRGIRLLVKAFPVFITIICLDALSDSFYNFAANYWLNETLSFGIGEINLMFLLTLTIAVPLTLYLGRVFDRRGGRRLTIGVYSVMPLAVGLLIIAQWVPHLAPEEWRQYIDSIYPGLSVILSIAFIATAIKSINDVLWMSLISTYIQKSLPRRDLGKMLGLTSFFTFLLLSVGPTPAGIIYELFAGLPVLLIALGLNIIILIILVTKNIEPKLTTEQLETGLI
jgi:MFS family permease